MFSVVSLFSDNEETLKCDMYMYIQRVVSEVDNLCTKEAEDVVYCCTVSVGQCNAVQC